MLDGSEPLGVVKIRINPTLYALPCVVVLLIKKLMAALDGIALYPGLGNTFPCVVRLNFRVPPFRGYEEPRVALGDILEITPSRRIGTDGEYIWARHQPRRNVDFIKRPVRLETTCRAASDERAIDVKLVGLVSRDE